jgi:hypothetical protein
MLISKDVKLIYSNSRGLGIDLTPLSDYCLVECSEELENTINSDKQGNLDGETFISSSLASRHLEISGVLNVAAGAAHMKRQIERVFNVTLPGVLTYINHATRVTRRIACYVEALPDVSLNGLSVSFVIQLQALKPFWIGAGMAGVISTINKAFRFPIVIPPEKVVFGYRLNVLENIINNVGDAASGVTFQLRAINGTVKNPSVIHKDSGYSIKVFYDMEMGDVIEIISNPDKASVIINQTEDGMKYLTDENARHFFTLFVGENTVGYNADENVANLEVAYKTEDMYLGV